MNAIINNCLTALNNIGRGFCNYSAGIFVQSSVLIVLLLLITFLTRKHVRATFRYWMWMLVFVKLVLPPTLSLPTGIGYWCGDFLSSDSSIFRQASIIAQQESFDIPAIQDFPESSVMPAINESMDSYGIVISRNSTESAQVPQIPPSQAMVETTVPTVPTIPAVPKNPTLNPITWQAVVFLTWLIGVLVILVLLIQRMLFVKGLIAQSEHSDERLKGMLNQCRRQLGIGRYIKLRLSNNISGPAVCGLFKPILLIPAALDGKLSPEKLRAVFIHELVHIQRGDLLINLIQTVLQIIYFYNPFVWLVNAVVRNTREQAVDEMVLVVLGNEAKNYTNTLIDVAEMAFLRTSLSLRLIGVVESKRALNRRIKIMLNRPVPKSAKLGILGLVVIIIIGAILLPMAKGNWGQKDQRQKDQIDKLVKKLSSEDDAVWEPAAEQLKEIGPKVARQVAELFRTATGDLHAIRVLESMATDEHVQDVMVQGLSAEPHLTNSNVRHCSLIILSKSGNRSHVKKIIPLLRKDVENGEDYSMAAIALAELGGDEAYNALVETVTKDIPDQLRFMIADDLAAMERLEAVPYLKDALKLVDPSHPSAGARIVEAIHRLEDKNEIVEKPYNNGLYAFTLPEFNSKYSRSGYLYARDLQRADDASFYVDKPPVGANTEETISGGLRALAAGSKGDLIFERVGEQTRFQAYHGTLLAPLEVKTEPPHYYWTDAVGKMSQSELKQLVLDYNNRHAKGIAGRIPGFRLYPFDEGDIFAAVLPSGQIAILATKKIVSYTSGVRLTVLYLDPLLALVGTGRIEASQDSTADTEKSQFVAILPNRITVELIGICEHPSQGKQWWRPDGNKLDQRPFEKLYTQLYPRRDGIYELAIKVNNPQRRKLNIIRKGGGIFNLYSDKIWGGNIFSEEKEMLNQSIGIAHGPWKTIAEAYPKLTQNVGDFAFGEAFESEVEGIGTAVGVTVTHTIGKEKVDCRVIAVDQKGNIHTSSSHSFMSGDSWMQTTVHFKDLRIDEIKDFQFQTRHYDWVTFKSVSLKPNFKTNVQVYAEGAKSVIQHPARNSINKYFSRTNVRQKRDKKLVRTLHEDKEPFEERVSFYIRDYGDDVLHCIDFDNNKIVRIPDELDINDKSTIMKWIKENGIDAMIRKASQLVALDMTSVMTENSKNDKLTSNTLENLSKKTARSTDILYSIKDGYLYYAFKTSQDRIGVVGLSSTENEGFDYRSLLIKYKLLKTDVQDEDILTELIESNKVLEPSEFKITTPNSVTSESPMAKTQKQSFGKTAANLDLDKDGLENRFEGKIGDNPKVNDADVEESDETNNKASLKLIPGRQQYISESTNVDIAIDDRDLIVTKLSDELFQAVIRIYNKGSAPSPEFGVYFYAGDPDKGGRLLATHAAGPIMPGDNWAEGTHPQRLESGENTISVVVDPGNKVEESDETNNKASQTISMTVSESERVDKVGTIQKVDLFGDDILLIEAQTTEGFNFPYYLFIPSGIDKDRQVNMLVETNNSGMVSDDLEVHRAKAQRLTERSHANRMARQLGVPLLVPTFPRPKTNWWIYTHALDIDTLEIEEGKLKRIDLQLTAMIKHAQELLRVNGFKINKRVFMHGFSASAKFCNRYSYLHPEMVKAVAAGGVNGLPTLPVRQWNDCELPFPIGISGIERFIDGPFNEKAFGQVAHYIYMGSLDRNDTLPSRDAWREEEADIIKKALAEKMMPDRWQLSRKIYRQQKLPAQLVTYNGVAHAIKEQMQDDVTDFFKANSGEKYVRIEPYEYPFVKSEESRPKYKSESAKVDIAIDDKDLVVTKQPDGLFRALIRIYNKGSMPIPQFGVYFYAGDSDEGGRLLATHAAGPIMPGGNWGEYNPRLKLKPSENTISVVVDPDNKVEESDETNNKASRTISTTVKVKPDDDSDAHPKSKPALRKADIAIENKYLTVRKQPDGRFRAGVSIHNYGNIATPQFKVIFYAGDPGKKGRKVYPGHHNAGPIMPGGTWNEGTLPFTLNEGETQIFVIVDPDNMVDESDETNNKASAAIPGRQRTKSEISEKPKTGHQRYFVRLVVGKDKMTFEGQEVTWEQLPSLLEKVTNRGNTVFEIAVSTKDIPLSRFDAAKSRAGKLIKQFGFEYLSYVGQHPLGSKAKSKDQTYEARITGETKKFAKILPNGVTVELVGVCDWPEEGKRCWRPDGSQLPMEIYTTKRNVESGFGKYGFMFKVTGPDDLKFSWSKILGASGWHGSCKVVDSKGNQLEGFEAAISNMEEGRLSTTIRVGIAAGPWETIASHDGKRMEIGREGGVLWSQAFQSYTGIHIVATREWRKDQVGRVIAIDKDGKVHTTSHGSVASGNIDQLTASFRNLKLGQIKEFQYQARPYQWIEFKNVSLRPGHNTDVQF